MDERRARAEAARQAILASGNPDLINRLRLLDVAAAQGAARGAGGQAAGPSLLGTAAAAGGGAALGMILGGVAMSAAMQAAFAEVAAEAGFDPAEVGEVLAASADAGLLDDLGLGDLDAGDLFDV